MATAGRAGAGALRATEVARYARHLLLPEVGLLGQRRLKAARVLVVGAGGLGSPALLYLAAAGVGTIGVVDDDVVEASNLQRQVIHGVADVGRPKTASAVDALRRRQPAGDRRAPRRAPGLRQRAGRDRRLRPRARRHRQLPHPLPRQRRVRAARQAARVGLDLPLRRAGQRVVGRARTLLPLRLPRAAAAGHGAVLRRGWRAGRAVRRHRVGPDHRGDQAADRGRRAAGRAADGARRAAPDLGHPDRPQGPRLRRVRHRPDGHRSWWTTRSSAGWSGPRARPPRCRP